MPHDEILEELKSLSDPAAVEGMARFGINPDHAYGVSIPSLREIAKRVGKSHALAERLWSSGIHEARILASMVDDPSYLSAEQMDRWAGDFNSWDLCDQCCNNLFRKSRFAHAKALEWAARKEEFVKRAGFTLMACRAVHDKKAGDADFMAFLRSIKQEADDERNYVKKAVNWALRQIGKRNRKLNREAVKVATHMRKLESKSAKWIGSHALRELTSEKVRNRLTSAE
jgi:3-methyladenine DNA glycosylase AlkD